VDKPLGKLNYLLEFYFSDEFVRVLREEPLTGDVLVQFVHFVHIVHIAGEGIQT
jgi:hypothetical protein